MAGLKLKDITKRYENGFEAVKKFNLEIKDREFIVFVGPSGCGKSTTLRMIAGLEEISDGELYIGDKLVNDVAPKDRNIAMVFQNYALYPHMTVYDNMAFALKIRKVSKAEIDKKVRAAAEILDIGHLLDRKPKALSGGQRQRVAMGRAIVRSPEVFLMDEPLSNLDAKLRGQMRIEIAKLYQELNTTFIYVTHDQTEAMTLGTRIVVMKDGIAQQIDSPKEIYENPQNIFVAGFIGSPQMNFLDATIIEENGKTLVKVLDKTIELPKEKQDLLKNEGYVGKEVILGIRPENIKCIINGVSS
ncbi:MAG: sn-glycerol-3-phosphate ABC transporter ATP-binding protein UgpC, partial [Eubacteriales bacterium]|nr:sn-glycerol-3-phosphate ABC transporter ATP-binding protein UgpC [Eubacteriales bacterium]